MEEGEGEGEREGEGKREERGGGEGEGEERRGIGREKVIGWNKRVGEREGKQREEE